MQYILRYFISTGYKMIFPHHLDCNYVTLPATIYYHDNKHNPSHHLDGSPENPDNDLDITYTHKLLASPLSKNPE